MTTRIIECSERPGKCCACISRASYPSAIARLMICFSSTDHGLRLVAEPPGVPPSELVSRVTLSIPGFCLINSKRRPRTALGVRPSNANFFTISAGLRPARIPLISKPSSSAVHNSLAPDWDRGFLLLEPWVPDKRSNAFFTGVKTESFEADAPLLGVKLSVLFFFGVFPGFAFDFVGTGALLTGA